MYFVFQSGVPVQDSCVLLTTLFQDHLHFLVFAVDVNVGFFFLVYFQQQHVDLLLQVVLKTNILRTY
jgi:hypothetical protein